MNETNPAPGPEADQELSIHWHNSLRFRIYSRFVMALALMLGASFYVLHTSGVKLLNRYDERVSELTGEKVILELSQTMTRIETLTLMLANAGECIATDGPGGRHLAQSTLSGEEYAGLVAGGAILIDRPNGGFRQEWLRGADGLIAPGGGDGEAIKEMESWLDSTAVLPKARLIWATPRRDPVTGDIVVACLTPIRMDGAVIGIASVLLETSALEDSLGPPEQDRPSYFMLLDRDNRPVVLPAMLKSKEHPEDLAALASSHPAYLQLADLITRLDGDLMLRTKWRLGSEREQAVDVKPADTESLMAAAVRLDVFGDMTKRSCVLGKVEIPDDPFLHTAVTAVVLHVPGAYWKAIEVAAHGHLSTSGRSEIIHMVAWLTVIMVIPMAVVFWFFSRDVMGPVRTMSGALMNLSQTEGDFMQGLGDSAPNELMELGYAFNKRTDALRFANVHLSKEIEERKRAEQALRESEARFRNVLENTRDALYKLDLRTMRFEYVSPAALPVTGYGPGEFLDLGPYNLEQRMHPDDASRPGVRLRDFAEMSGSTALAPELEYRLLNKQGAYIWISENRTLVGDAKGRPTAIVGSIRDVTFRKAAEEEMTQLRHYLQNIINSMPSMLIGVDPDGLVSLWNLEVAQATGVAASDALGKPFEDVFSLFPGQMDRAREALRLGDPIENDRLTGEGPGRELLFYDLVVFPLATNELRGGVIRIDDVTTRVQIEEMMVQTEKMMSVGGLAAGMAHEINNPLGGILQACQNIIRRTSPDLPKNHEVASAAGVTMEAIMLYMRERGILDFIEGIRSDGVRASKIVADMLAFSRRSESHLAPANIGELVDTVLRLAANDYDLKKHYDFRRIRIIKELDSSLPDIRCDKTKIEQVLLNLVKNAAQALGANPGQEEPFIAIRATREDRFARIEVADNGPGMDEQIRRRVFEPFFTTKEVGIGTGLGLSVSYFIISKQHRGSINVESAPGQGARFIIRLPLLFEEPNP